MWDSSYSTISLVFILSWSLNSFSLFRFSICIWSFSSSCLCDNENFWMSFSFLLIFFKVDFFIMEMKLSYWLSMMKGKSYQSLIWFVGPRGVQRLDQVGTVHQTGLVVDVQPGAEETLSSQGVIPELYQVLLMRSCSISYLVSSWRISLSNMSNLCQGIQSAATERTRERSRTVSPAQLSQAQLELLSFELFLVSSGSAGGLIIDSSWSIVVLSAGMQQSGKGRGKLEFTVPTLSVSERN